MGIDVDGKIVTLTNDHQLKVNTSTDHNPTRSKFGSLNVVSVFQRLKTNRDPGQDKDPDGNPLIYAMKGIKKYTIDEGHRNDCLVRTQEILQTIDFETDYILPLPSSSPFCAEFTRLVCAASEELAR